MIANVPLDGDLEDIAGQENDGTVTGTESYTAGPKVRQAFDFNGSTRVELDNEGNFDFERTDSFSVTCWMKKNGGAVNSALVGKRGSGNQGWLLYLRIGAEASLFLSDGTNSPERYDSGNSINDNAWHHVAATYDGTSSNTGIKIYVDGVDKTGTTAGADMTSTMLNNHKASIGRQVDDQIPLTGQVADVQVWDKVLSLTEVLRIRNEPQLISNHTLDGVVTDSEGDNNGTVTGTTAYTSGPKNAQAFDFNGSSYVTLDNETNFDIEYTRSQSITGWFKSSMTAAATLVGKMVNSGTYRGWDVAFNNAVDDGKIGFQIISDVTTNNWINWWTTAGGWNDGVWHHFACVYNGDGNETDITVYIDGVSEAGDAAAPNEDITATMLQDTAISIGSRSAGGLPYTGQLAEVKIWHGELSAEEVQNEYMSSKTDLKYNIDPVGAVRVTPRRSSFEYNRKLSLNMK